MWCVCVIYVFVIVMSVIWSLIVINVFGEIFLYDEN